MLELCDEFLLSNFCSNQGISDGDNRSLWSPVEPGLASPNRFVGEVGGQSFR